MSTPMGDLGSAIGGWVADVPCQQYASTLDGITTTITNIYNSIDATISNRLTAVETTIATALNTVLNGILPILTGIESSIERYQYLIQESILVQLAPIAANVNLLLENNTILARAFPDLLARSEVNLSQIFNPTINVAPIITQSQTQGQAQAQTQQEQQSQVSLADLQSNQINEVTSVQPTQVLVSQPQPQPIVNTPPALPSPQPISKFEPESIAPEQTKPISKEATKEEDCDRGQDARYLLSDCGLNEVDLFLTEKVGLDLEPMKSSKNLIEYLQGIYKTLNNERPVSKQFLQGE